MSRDEQIGTLLAEMERVWGGYGGEAEAYEWLSVN